MLIYKITNILNNKMYVGLTITNLKKRFSGHKLDALSKKHNMPLHKAMRKYGISNFTIEQIDTAESIDELNEKEKYWIRELSTKVPNGYNLSDGGLGHTGRRGVNAHQSILKYRDVQEIKLLIGKKFALILIAEYYDVHQSVIQGISAKRTYIDIPPLKKPNKKVDIFIEKHKDYRKISGMSKGTYLKSIDNKSISQIKYLLSHNISRHIISKNFNVSGHQVTKIKNGKLASKIEACGEDLQLLNQFKILDKEYKEERYRKTAIRSKNRVWSKESKEKLSNSLTGRRTSEESKKKLSLAHTGKKLSEEHKRKISESSKGKKMSPETKERLSKINKGRKVSEEIKQKIKLGTGKYYENKTPVLNSYINTKKLIDPRKSCAGSKNGSAKLNEDQVKEIKKLLKDNIRGNKIAEMFGVVEQTISFIKTGSRWGHIE